jgi:esterase/lipase
MESNEMKLDIQPTVALVDQKVDICISELPAFGKVKLSASYRLPWAQDVLYESYAWFTADAKGQVDLSQQKPDSGSYDYISSMGLIESVTSSDPKALEKITQNISLDNSLFIEVTAESGPERASVTLERIFKTPEVKRQRIMDEFVGDFFYSGNPDNKTILWLGGSGSNLAINSVVAAPLASHGFNVLAVAFFGEKGLPAQLSRIPLDYFDKVFAWLANNPHTAGKDIQILGMSKGAELALLLASRYPSITRVAVWAPHAYCFQGIAYKYESSWTCQGKDLPYIHWKNSWAIAEMLRCMIKNEPFGFTTLYRKALSVAKNKEAARIRVEEAHADLMLFTSTDCGMWNTYDGSIEIMETLRKCHYPHSYELVVYPDAGEPYLVPYVFPVGITSAKMMPRLVLSMGGTLAGNAHARTDAWEKAIAFLN